MWKVKLNWIHIRVNRIYTPRMSHKHIQYIDSFLSVCLSVCRGTVSAFCVSDITCVDISMEIFRIWIHFQIVSLYLMIDYLTYMFMWMLQPYETLRKRLQSYISQSSHGISYNSNLDKIQLWNAEKNNERCCPIDQKTSLRKAACSEIAVQLQLLTFRNRRPNTAAVHSEMVIDSEAAH